MNHSNISENNCLAVSAPIAFRILSAAATAKEPPASSKTGPAALATTTTAASNMTGTATNAAPLVWLTTHRFADGDGLACEAAFAASLHNQDIAFQIVNFETPSKRYEFLFNASSGTHVPVTLFATDPTPKKPDLIVIFDTNDMRLLEPLASWARAHAIPCLIVDHHEDLPNSSTNAHCESWIDKKAASSGEVLLSLLDQLGWPVDTAVATRLYASLVFDTQNFRFIRASANSHTIAARLLPLVRDPERVHEHLLANFTPAKLGFIAQGLSEMRIEASGQLAIIVLNGATFHRFDADPGDSGEIVDMALNVQSVKVALLLREESSGRWKVSLRSKKGFSVLEAAEAVNGGGHRNAAGATITWDSLAGLAPSLRDSIMQQQVSFASTAQATSTALASAIEALLKPLLLAEIRRHS